MIEFTLDQALQKGIEAHKAGQVQEADRLYTAILQAQPKHPDANHNMGVLAVGVGKVQEALPFFKTALEASPTTAQFWLSYIDALIGLNKLAEAKAVLDQAKGSGAKGEAFDKLDQRLEGVEPPNITVSQNQDPPQDQLQPLINLYSQGQFQHALDSVEKLLQKFPISVTLYNIQGAANADLGQIDAAIDSYNKAIDIKPNYAQAHNNMGTMLQKAGKLEDAIDAFNKALALKPNYAEAYYNMGSALQGQGKLDGAIEAYNMALVIKPNMVEAYNNLGNALEEQGKLKDAIEAFKKAVTLKPDMANASHMLSALTGKKNNSSTREYVEELFDRYAEKFDSSLIKELEYEIPKILTDLTVKEHGTGSLGSVLDLGCGTGLAGLEIKRFCSNLEGIDLSNQMIERARIKSVYDKLTHVDIIEYLSNAELNFDYFIATDVFVYVGELSKIFRLIKSRNKKSGRLAFTTEHTVKRGFHIEKSGRYSHSKSYIESLCKKFNYSISHFSKTNLRKEKGIFLPGGIYLLDF